MKTPIVFIIFNRPDTTEIVFKKIRAYQPKELFIIADGPRKDRPYEAELCEKARNIINVDWDCKVTYIYSDINLGCQKRISSGIDEVFNKVERAIILEDDCVPHIDFFTYCEELLDRYEYDSHIMAISGNNFQDANFKIEESYYFSIYNHCWGWATWKSAWNHFDVDMKRWPNMKRQSMLKEIFDDPFAQLYWEDIFEKVYKKQIDSWAYPWMFACWLQNGLTVLPKRNLVSNIGFGENATHTKGSDPLTENLPTYSLDFPLKHPQIADKNNEADQHTTDYIFGVSRLKERAIIDVKKVLLYEKILNDDINILYPFKRIAIFGTGNLGRVVGRYARSQNVQVLYYIDNNEKNHGKLIEGIPVVSIGKVDIQKLEAILVSVEGHHDNEIIQKLSKSFSDLKIISWKELVR